MIIPDKKGPHFGNRNSDIRTRIRRRMLLSGNVPQGITNVPWDESEQGWPRGPNDPRLNLPSIREWAF